jgi:DNA-directed RNA polymerase specialized sigma24 family protein
MNRSISQYEEPVAAHFHTTDWSTVRKAVHKSHAARGSALDQLCTLYWKPLYYFARRNGHSPEESQDLTQGFFAIVIEKSYFQSADQQRGRFRTFILAAFQNFVRNGRAYRLRAKRGGSYSFVPLDTHTAEIAYSQEHYRPDTAPILFDRTWAVTLVGTALDELRAEFARVGKAPQFCILEPFFTNPGEISYADAADALHLSEAAVRVAVHRARTRYGKLLRKVVAATVSDDSEVDDELRYLLAVLSR